MYSSKGYKEDPKAEPRYIETDPNGRYARVNSESYNFVAFYIQICCGYLNFDRNWINFLLLECEKCSFFVCVKGETTS